MGDYVSFGRARPVFAKHVTALCLNGAAKGAALKEAALPAQNSRSTKNMEKFIP